MAQAVMPLASAGFSIAGGFAQRKAARERAAAAEYEARSFDLRAKQVTADRNAELRESLAAMSVARAGVNLDPTSPTSQALENEMKFDNQNAKAREVLSERQSAFAKRNEARQHRQAGTMALISGFGAAIGQASQSSLFKPGKGE